MAYEALFAALRDALKTPPPDTRHVAALRSALTVLEESERTIDVLQAIARELGVSATAGPRWSPDLHRLLAEIAAWTQDGAAIVHLPASSLVADDQYRRASGAVVGRSDSLALDTLWEARMVRETSPPDGSHPLIATAAGHAVLAEWNAEHPPAPDNG